jgi:hypothetical protein
VGMTSLEKYLERIRETGEPYLDIEFPPDETSMDGRGKSEPHFDRMAHWRRLEQLETRPVIFSSINDRFEVHNSQFSNQCFTSVVSCLYQREPKLIKKLFITNELH